MSRNMSKISAIVRFQHLESGLQWHRCKMIWKKQGRGYLTILALICLLCLFLKILVSVRIAAEKDANRYIDQVQHRAVKVGPSLPVFTPILPAEQTVAAVVQRDPFRSVDIRSTRAFSQVRKKYPLEAFPLDVLHFVGTIYSAHTRWGLIMQPGGFVTHVAVGDYLGKNEGRILSIQANAIRLRESGRQKTRVIRLEQYDAK